MYKIQLIKFIILRQCIFHFPFRISTKDCFISYSSRTSHLSGHLIPGLVDFYSKNYFFIILHTKNHIYLVLIHTFFLTMGLGSIGKSGFDTCIFNSFSMHFLDFLSIFYHTLVNGAWRWEIFSDELPFFYSVSVCHFLWQVQQQSLICLLDILISLQN